MSWDIFPKSKIQYFLEKLKGKFVQKETGKGLSTNDYTTAEKNKVATIDNKADKVSSATNCNLAGLNGSGNLTDSGWNGAKDTTSISGNPISISGLKSNQLAVNPIITLEPIQAGSGTPSPSNVRAISGYDKVEALSCGVNVWDEEWEVGSINNADGQNNNADTNNIRSKNYNVIEPNKSYYNKVVSGYIWIHYYDANKNWISGTDLPTGGGVFTTPNNSNIKYYRIRTTANYGSKYLGGIGINYPTTQTSYVASNKTTDLSESLGQTVYGLTDDVRSGLCTDIWTKIDASTLSWGYNGTQKRYEADLPNAKSVGSGRSDKIVCSKYATDVDVTAGDSWKVFQSGRTVFVYDASQSGTPSGDIAYILANTTIQLTPHEISLLSNYAYVSTNGTSIALDYHNGELASLSDVSQLGETVNELGMNLLNVVEDVTSKFVLDSTNVYTSTMQVLKIGKMVFISGSIKPQALTSLQNKKLFDITDNRLFPLVGASANITANFVPVETAQSTTLPLITVINSSYSQLRTLNNGAYGGITNITTSSLIIFSGAYVCKG